MNAWNGEKTTRDGQSIFAPERFTTSAHFAESLRITSANSSGVPPAGSSPISPNLALNMGETIALLIEEFRDRKSTRLNSSHLGISYAVFCLKKKTTGVYTWRTSNRLNGS